MSSQGRDKLGNERVRYTKVFNDVSKEPPKEQRTL